VCCDVVWEVVGQGGEEVGGGGVGGESKREGRQLGGRELGVRGKSIKLLPKKPNHNFIY